MKTRLEHDSLGEIQVPADAYYGVQTLRAMVNFKDISGITISDHPYYVKALAMVKWAAAHANVSLGTLEEEIGVAIKKACEEIMQGALAAQNRKSFSLMNQPQVLILLCLMLSII